MPTLHEAIVRHINYFLTIVEMADSLFSEEKTQEKATKIFDRNREQINLAIEQILRQAPSNETDLVLARFIDGVSSVGMTRYSVSETLIPLAEQRVLAAQRLGWKALEADALDGLGILYAFLGYLRQAISYFEMAMGIADQAGEKDIQQDIQSHLQRAQKQLSNRRQLSAPKLLEVLRLILLRVKLLFAGIRGNRFSDVALLNKIASAYLSFERWELAIRYYEKAILLSREFAYRLGELEAAMGLLQAKMSKDAADISRISTDTVHNLINEFGFEWGPEFDIFETLLELAPVIKNIEIIASQWAQNNDSRASELYGLLDQIISKIDRLVVIESEVPEQKHALFVTVLQDIKEDLARIVEITSKAIESS